MKKFYYLVKQSDLEIIRRLLAKGIWHDSTNAIESSHISGMISATLTRPPDKFGDEPVADKYPRKAQDERAASEETPEETEARLKREEIESVTGDAMSYEKQRRAGLAPTEETPDETLTRLKVEETETAKKMREHAGSDATIYDKRRHRLIAAHAHDHSVTDTGELSPHEVLVVRVKGLETTMLEMAKQTNESNAEINALKRFVLETGEWRTKLLERINKLETRIEALEERAAVETNERQVLERRIGARIDKLEPVARGLQQEPQFHGGEKGEVPDAKYIGSVWEEINDIKKRVAELEGSSRG